MVPDTTSQVSYDSSFPEAHGQTEDSPKGRASSHLVIEAALKWPWMVVALVVAAAIAIGVGVIRCGTCKDRISSSLTFIGRRCRSIITIQLLHNISLMIHLWRL